MFSMDRRVASSANIRLRPWAVEGQRLASGATAAVMAVRSTCFLCMLMPMLLPLTVATVAVAVRGAVQPAVVSAEGPARDAPPEETSSLSGALFKKAKTHVTLMAKSLGERWSPKKRTDDHAKRGGSVSCCMGPLGGNGPWSPCTCYRTARRMPMDGRSHMLLPFA